MYLDDNGQKLHDLANRIMESRGMNFLMALGVAHKELSRANRQTAVADLSADQIEYVNNRVRTLQMEGSPLADAKAKACSEVLKARGLSATPDAVRTLVAGLRTPKDQLSDDPVHCLAKRIEREQGLNYRDALTLASGELAKIEADQRERLAKLAKPEMVCGNCKWCLRYQDSGFPSSCNFAPAPRAVEESRPGCSEFGYR